MPRELVRRGRQRWRAAGRPARELRLPRATTATTGWPSPRRFPIPGPRPTPRGHRPDPRRRCRSWPAQPGPGCSWAASPNGAPATGSATAPCCSIPGAVVARLSEDAPLRCRRPGRQAASASRRRSSPAARRWWPTRPGAAWGSASATTSGSRSSTGRSRRAAPAIVAVPSAFTAGDRQGPLARPAARAGHREPGLPDGARRSSAAHGRNRRSYGHALVIDPWGVVAGRVRRPRRRRPRPPRLRLPGSGARRALPVLTHRRFSERARRLRPARALRAVLRRRACAGAARAATAGPRR